MTGYAALDAAGSWRASDKYGEVWDAQRAARRIGRPTATAIGDGLHHGAGAGSTTSLGVLRPSHYGRWLFADGKWSVGARQIDGASGLGAGGCRLSGHARRRSQLCRWPRPGDRLVSAGAGRNLLAELYQRPRLHPRDQPRQCSRRRFERDPPAQGWRAAGRNRQCALRQPGVRQRRPAAGLCRRPAGSNGVADDPRPAAAQCAGDHGLAADRAAAACTGSRRRCRAHGRDASTPQRSGQPAKGAIGPASSAPRRSARSNFQEAARLHFVRLQRAALRRDDRGCAIRLSCGSLAPIMPCSIPKRARG